MNRFAPSLLLLLVASTAYAADAIEVKIIQRRTSSAEYGYIVPSITTSDGSANCFGSRYSANCTASGTEVTVPAHEYSYQVRGATFTLLLPDGRRAVVNCVSKYAPRGDYINQRDCRTPLVDDIKVEFNDDNAKLIWPVSLDGKKTQSETYKILAVLKED